MPKEENKLVSKMRILDTLPVVALVICRLPPTILAVAVPKRSALISLIKSSYVCAVLPTTDIGNPIVPINILDAGTGIHEFTDGSNTLFGYDQCGFETARDEPFIITTGTTPVVSSPRSDMDTDSDVTEFLQITVEQDGQTLGPWDLDLGFDILPYDKDWGGVGGVSNIGSLPC